MSIDDINDIILNNKMANGWPMGNLVVRNINDDVVKALKALAGKDGISAEAEHRKILESVLLRPEKKSFSEVLRLMPDVGKDSDFERIDDNRADNVFD